VRTLACRTAASYLAQIGGADTAARGAAMKAFAKEKRVELLSKSVARRFRRDATEGREESAPTSRNFRRRKSF